MVMEKIDILRLLQFSCLIDNYLCTFLWIRNIFVTTHSIHLSFFHQHLSKKCVQQNVTRKTEWYLLQFHESEEQVDNLTVHGEKRLKKGKIWQQLSIKVTRTRTIPSLWAMTDTDDMCGTSRIWKMELKLMAWKVSLYSKCYKIWYLFLAQNVRKDKHTAFWDIWQKFYLFLLLVHCNQNDNNLLIPFFTNNWENAGWQGREKETSMVENIVT